MKEISDDRLKEYPEGTIEKTCSVCGKIKPVEEFDKVYVKNNTNYRKGYCKTCMNAKRNAPHKVHENRSRWNKRYKLNKDKKADYDKKYRAENKDGVIARRKLNEAILHGTIDKKPCAVCGDLKADAHHFDYDRELEVIWLCRRHHALLHKSQEKAVLSLRSLNKRLVEDGERLADRLDAVKNMMVGKPPLKLAWTTGIEPVLDQHAAMMKEIGEGKG
jgi:hypothetical protein